MSAQQSDDLALGSGWLAIAITSLGPTLSVGLRLHKFTASAEMGYRWKELADFAQARRFVV